MATAWVECWKCDACGHRWIKGELYPTQCGKCRSRKWNELTEIDSTRLSETVKSTKQILRDICDGKIQPLEETPTHSKSGGPADRGATQTAGRIPICGFKWWEDGEQYECLMDKGHREPKHGLRGLLIRLDD